MILVAMVVMPHGAEKRGTWDSESAAVVCAHATIFGFHEYTSWTVTVVARGGMNLV